MLTKDTAICIRAVDYSETSQILTFFTKAVGKIGAIARGSKRPKSSFDGPIEMFAHGRIVFSDSAREKLATLTEFQQQPAFTHLADDLFTLNCASFAAELVNKLTDDYDPHPKLFDSFLQFLQNTNEERLSADLSGEALAKSEASAKAEDTLSLLILFQLSLLREIGLMPILNACANCKTSIEYRVSSIEHRVFFSSSANGLICRDCEASFPDKIALTNNAANCLLVLSESVLGSPVLSNVEGVEGLDVKLLAKADKKTLNEIERVLISHFTEILHRPPKMAKYITLDS